MTISCHRIQVINLYIITLMSILVVGIWVMGQLFTNPYLIPLNPYPLLKKLLVLPIAFLIEVFFGDKTHSC
jgi:hypothetical protein